MSNINKIDFNLNDIVNPLLDWYDNNARVLPWRENTDPYRVWVSEIMLQQTRVEAVIPYYERFMRELPTIESLAEATEDRIMKLWEGLGYYSRVRNMQKAAQIICAEYNGIFPSDYENILTLPGIGEYTAGAISSIAFKQPIPAVDGNVLRVITRLTENYEDITKPYVKKLITNALKDIYPISRSGDFTQSIMELGAIICTPNGFPRCEQCPLNSICKAFINSTQMLLPVKEKKQSRTKHNKTVLLLCCNDKIAVRKRENSGLLAGLWELPNEEGLFSEDEVKQWLYTNSFAAKKIIRTPDKKHIFTHIEWRMIGYLIDCTTVSTDYTWVTKEQLKHQISLPTVFKKFISSWK